MRDEIKRLTGLQTIDQELRFQEQELSKITAQVDELQARVEQSSAELERLKQEDREAALARRELERTLAEGEVQIRNKRMRLSLIKNDRELQALGHEVEVLKESNQRLEAELLARMDGGDQKSARIAGTIRDRWRGSGRSLRKLKKRSPARSRSCRRGPRHGAGNAGNWRRKSMPTCCQRYEVIFGRRGGLAVVAVKSGTCQGCRMRIPPQLFNQIQRYEAIHFCPNCQRILYHEPDKQTEA